MRGLAVVAAVLVLLGTGCVVVGSVPAAPAPLSPADSGGCPTSGPVSANYGPAPFGQAAPPFPTIAGGSGPIPAVMPAAVAHPTPVTTVNVTVSTGDLVVVTAEGVNFAKGSAGGINNSGEPVLTVSDSVGSLYVVGNYSGYVDFNGRLFVEAPGGALGSDENLTWATWVGTAGGSGVDSVTVTLTNPAPDTSLGYPGFTEPQVLVTAYPAGYAAIVGGWQDFWNPSFSESDTHPSANVTTYGLCADLLAEGFAAGGFVGNWGVSPSSVDFGLNTNFTPVNIVTGYSLGMTDEATGHQGIYNDVRITNGPIPAVETFNSWAGYTAGDQGASYVGYEIPASSYSEEQAYQLIAVGPDLAPYGLGSSPNGCTSATLSWTNPAPPQGKTLVNDTVYLYTSSGTLIQTISTGGPATGITVTGLLCGAKYWFQVQPWWTGAIPGGLSGALSFIAGQFAGTAIGPASAVGFLGLGVTDWAAIGAVAAAGAVVAVALTRHRGRHAGSKIGR